MKFIKNLIYAIFYSFLFTIFVSFFLVVIPYCFAQDCYAQDSDYVCSHPFTCVQDNTGALDSIKNAAYIQSGVKSQFDSATLTLERKAKSYVPKSIIPVITAIGIGYKTYKSKSIKFPIGQEEIYLNINSISVRIPIL